MKKQGNGNVARSEESMTRMTSYRFPPTVTDPSHLFRMTINVFSHYDALPWVLLYRQARKWLESRLCRLFNVILNGRKNAL